MLLSLTIATASCGGGSRHVVTSRVERGGTLHAALLSFTTAPITDEGPPGADYFLDPQRSYDPASWEILRCCLLRTLLSYNGRPTAGGGAELRPDLASAMPTVSRDGLTWIFHLQRGLHYAPPFERTEIQAGDIVRAIERDLTPIPGLGGRIKTYLSPYRFYYEQVIAGATRYSNGEANSISGLQTPDDHTLVIHLLRRAGDLGYRLALPGAAPIPSSPWQPGSRLGAAVGHGDGYGRFLVASGPYMLAGSSRLDFSAPPVEQAPAKGYVRGKTLTLVRNPSWNPRSDDLRQANVDRIEFHFGEQTRRAAADVDRGRLDMVFDANPPAEQVARYLRSPQLRSRVLVYPGDYFYFLPMNLAVRPFDDVHVRKAVNYAIDKAGLVRLANLHPFYFGPAYATVDSHLGTDDLEGNLLEDYDPYATPGHRGDVVAARREMAASRYDANHDGRCDAAACKNVRLVVYADGGLLQMASLVRRDLREIGLDVRIRIVSANVFAKQQGPAKRAPLGLGYWWIMDFPNGSGLFEFFDGRAITRADSSTPPNVSLVGATPFELRRLGYSVRSVPSVDDRIDRCLPLIGLAQVECWAALDQYLMERVVPWVPFLRIGYAYVVSARVRNLTYDQFTGLAALDQISLAHAS